MAKNVSILLIVLRLGIAALWLASCSSLGVVYGLFEVGCCSLAVWNWWVAGGWDSRPVGWVVPVSYYLGAAVVPVSSAPWGGSQAVAVLCMLAGASLVANLGSSYSVGHASWVRLVDWGWYSVVRHPMTLLRVLMRWALVYGNWSSWNLGVSVVWSLVVLWAIVVEEGFLTERVEYRAYVERVPWRLIPWVW